MKYFVPVFLIVGSLLFNDLVAKSTFPARGFAKVLSDQEASNRLNSYRSFFSRDLNQSGFHQGYAFRVKFRHMPRRGKEFSKTGTIYGLALGHSISRLDLNPSDGNFSEKNYLFHTHDLPRAWVLDKEDSKPKKLTNTELFDPIVDGMNHTPVDILMPFVFWEFEYIKSGKVAGRPSHIYSFNPPNWVKNLNSDSYKISMALDANYQAPLRIETFLNGISPRKTLILKSLKKISDQWVVKSIDCRENINRSNTRFEVTSAALNLDLDETFFTPDGLFNAPVISEELFISTM